MLICGIDEAGRGPVIGPLVMCGLLIKEEDEKELVRLKVKDSKLLTRKQREFLFDKIKDVSKRHKIIVINPQEIDRAVHYHDGLNLNKLEARKSAEILNELNPNKAIIDTPSNNIKSYKKYLSKFVNNKDIELILEHKADVNYPVVSAASILAKVTRDNEIEKLKKQIGIDFGSGYMTDPKTVEFLKNNFENYPDLFRKSWFPYKDLLNQKFQKSLGDFTQFLKEEQKHKSHTLEDLKKLEEFGFHFETPKSEHELAVMKGPCTVVLYKNGKLLIQGKEEVKKNVMKLLGISI
ncbi:ribonuclease HII [Candidatus Woesearchaeota archaeon]|nr:ribonuclease HII [Candidatus Woesearchaeota archaeon]